MAVLSPWQHSIVASQKVVAAVATARSINCFCIAALVRNQALWQSYECYSILSNEMEWFHDNQTYRKKLHAAFFSLQPQAILQQSMCCYIRWKMSTLNLGLNLIDHHWTNSRNSTRDLIPILKTSIILCRCAIPFWRSSVGRCNTYERGVLLERVGGEELRNLTVESKYCVHSTETLWNR